MKLHFKKKSALQSRIEEIEAEMVALQRDMRDAAKVRERPLSSGFPAYRGRAQAESPLARRPPQESPAEPTSAQRQRDERFANYLASSFQTSQSLKHEKRLQRNKAIFMLVVVALLLFWVLWQVFNVFLS